MTSTIHEAEERLSANTQPRYADFEAAARSSTSFVAFIDQDAPQLDAELATRFSVSSFKRDKGGVMTVSFSLRRYAQLVSGRPYYEFVQAPKNHPLNVLLVSSTQCLLWFRRPKNLTERTRDILFPFQLDDEFYLFDRNSFEPALAVRLHSYQQEPTAATGYVVVDVTATF